MEYKQKVLEILSELEIDGSFYEKLEKYVSELDLFNSAYDLVGADNKADIFIKHVLDCLAAVPELKRQIVRIQDKKNSAEFRIADVGSGGGLPGIPLAIVFPEIHFTLIERMSKRCTFLENCVLMLGLKNVDVVNSEVEKIAEKNFDIVVFRAFRPLEKKMAKTLLSLPSESGIIAAYKAKKSKIETEMTAINDIVPQWKCIPLNTSFLGDGKEERERNLVIFSRA